MKLPKRRAPENDAECHVFRDVILMINGAVGGLRTLGWSLFILTLPVYAFALFITEMVAARAVSERCPGVRKRLFVFGVLFGVQF